ncbi:hypothetical protein R3P38DRAFT_3438829 [Favolaschia claudopus]|uniref:SWIM-type domain-containing protein n=1 Tax=Favolaschia claudopus TaxID=2862362 RepID=A0AAV9ZRM5_9AGAR
MFRRGLQQNQGNLPDTAVGNPFDNAAGLWQLPTKLPNLPKVAEKSVYPPESSLISRRWHHVLKNKFLHGKRNRQLDHLPHILVHAVLPYYALKQRRQDLGLEGPDAEVQKRQDIEIRGATYTADDIALIEEDGVFKVTSQSDPSRAYDVDLKAYTCTCFDFPGISFCKHLCAVQRIFGKDFHDHLDNNDPHTARPAITQVRSLLTVADPDPDAMEMTGAPMQNLAGIADQLERLAARLRLPPTTQIPDDAIASLQSSRGAMFLATDDVSILPSKQRLAPVVKDKTARNTMMPRIKTKRTPAGDAAYGAGASSGSKASKTTNKKKTRKAVLPAPNFSLPPPPPPLLISAPAQTYQQAPPLPPHASYPPQGLLHPAPSNVSSAYPGYGIPPTYYYSQYPPYHSVPYTSYQQ